MRRRVTLIEEREILNLYKKGFMIKDIHNKLNRHRITITKIIKKHNIPIRVGSRKYKCNENFFEIIDNEKKAYWLGFITADGCISKNILYITLKKSDDEHLKKFLKDINSNNPIYYIKNINKTCTIQIYSSKLVNDLKKYGVVPNKTHIIKPYTNLNEKLQKHYWRGLIDGDGCISKTEIQWAISLSGNKYMVEGFSKYIKSIIKTNANITCRKKSTVWRFKCGGNNITKKVIMHLYKDAQIYLDRKMELAQQIMNMKKYVKPSKFKYITRQKLIEKYKELKDWKKVNTDFKMSLSTGYSLRKKFNLIDYVL